MLTPEEIESKVFTSGFRGYNPEEVDDFLQEISDSYVDAYNECQKAKEDVRHLSEAIEKYKSIEGTITGAASVADKSALEIENEARKKAESIIKSAEFEAKSIIAGAEQKIANESYRYEKLKREIELYKAKIVELLNSQLSVIKDYPAPGALEFSGFEKDLSNQEVSNDDIEMTKVRNKVSVSDEVTDRIETVNIDEDEKENKDKDEVSTDELPCVSVNENGEYVVADN